VGTKDCLKGRYIDVTCCLITALSFLLAQIVVCICITNLLIYCVIYICVSEYFHNHMREGVACLGFEPGVGIRILIFHFWNQGSKRSIALFHFALATFWLPDPTLPLLSSAIHLNYNTLKHSSYFTVHTLSPRYKEEPVCCLGK
jgi:hypothetical protein